MNNTVRIGIRNSEQIGRKLRGNKAMSKEAIYRKCLIKEMRKQGATDTEIGLVSDVLILNSMKNGRNPEEVAWALLQ